MSDIKNIKEELPLAFESITFPVRGDEYGHIFDADNNLICDIRGWGRFQYLDDPDSRMQQIETLVVTALNHLNDIS